MATSTAYATLRPEQIVVVPEKTTAQATEEFMTYKQTLTGAEIGTIVKDGLGTLTVEEDYNVKSSLQVREGELYIGNGKDGEHVTILAQPHVAGSPTISVGGKNASLVLDNATYKYYISDSKGNRGYSSAIAIGNLDGAGSIELRNGSTLTAAQSFFAYNNACADHVQASYSDKKGDTLYTGGDHTKRSQLVVSGASKAQAGMTFYFADIDISISGEGSIFEDGVRAIDGNAGWLGDDDGSGATDVVTNVTISDGGTWTSRHDLKTSAATTATTNILVTGNGSSFNSNRTTYFGYAGANGTTNLTVEKGAVANIVDMNVGVAAGTETVNIAINDKTSTLNAGKMVVNQGGTITNNGKIALSDKVKVTSWRDDSIMGLGDKKAEVSETVAKGIEIAGGKLINNGTVEGDIVMSSGSVTLLHDSKTGAITATSGTLSVLGDVVFNGDIMLSNTGFLFTDGATIDLQGNDFSFDGGSITIVVNAATPVMAVFSLEEEEMLASYGITFKNAGTVTGFEDDIEVTIVTMDAEGQITETGTYILKSSDVTVQSIPEPTTATLSLLALAGLCARRRRK